MEGWKSDEVGFVVLFECEKGVTELLDVDTTGEGGFLGVVTL